MKTCWDFFFRQNEATPWNVFFHSFAFLNRFLSRQVRSVLISILCRFGNKLTLYWFLWAAILVASWRLQVARERNKSMSVGSISISFLDIMSLQIMNLFF